MWIFALVLIGIGCLCLSLKSRSNSLDTPLTDKVIFYLADYLAKYSYFPKTETNLDSLLKYAKCDKRELEITLFILEKQNKIKRFRENGRENYSLVIQNELEVKVPDVTRDTIVEKSEVLPILEKARKELLVKEVNGWTKVSDKAGLDEEGISRMAIFYDKEYKMVKIYKEGVDSNGDYYHFCRYSKR